MWRDRSTVRPSGTVLPLLSTGSLVENGTLGEGLQTVAAAHRQYYIRPANGIPLPGSVCFLQDHIVDQVLCAEHGEVCMHVFCRTTSHATCGHSFWLVTFACCRSIFASTANGKNETLSSNIAKRSAKTYNRRDSQMVTHSSTSRPVQCLCMAERTGCPVFTDLWSYVP